MKYEKKRKMIILASLVAFVICIGIGFAAFSTTLKINGSAKVSPDAKNFKVVFANSKIGDDYSYADIKATTNPADLDTDDGVIDNGDVPSVSGMHVTFTEDNQSATYDFLVANIGKYDAYLTNIVFGTKTCTPGEGADPSLVSEACKDIKMEFTIGNEDNKQTFYNTSDLENHILAKGTSEPVKVVISYPEGSTLPDGIMSVYFGNLELIYATVDDNISFNSHTVIELLKEKGTHYLMTQDSSTSYPFGFNFNCERIINVKFVPYINIPADAFGSKDVSANQDGSVMAWYVLSHDDDEYIQYHLNRGYDLYIGADGLISLYDASYLFLGYRYVKNIDLTYVDTSNAVNMKGMFHNCGRLSNITFGEFDTSNVTDMSSMFDGCYNLESVDLSTFNTSNVLDMSFMFKECAKLEKIDLSSFDTSKVTNMRYMFYDCNALNNINLSIFNTSNVTDMTYMFKCCFALKKLNFDSISVDSLITSEGIFDNLDNLIELNISNASLTDAFVQGLETANFPAELIVKLKDTELNRSKVGTLFTNVIWV